MNQDAIYNAVRTVCELCFLQAHSTAVQLPLYSTNSWLSLCLCVFQLALKCTIHAQSHMWWAYVPTFLFLFAPFPLHRCILISTPARGNSLHHNYRINVGEKRGVGRIAKRKGEKKEKWALVWREKREGAPQPEWGVDLISNYPPAPQMISWCLKLIGFLDSAGGESSWGALTPVDLKARATWPGHPGCTPHASVMQSILVRHQTTDVASCWLHLFDDL